MTRELRYWKNKYEYLKGLYNAALEVLKANPENPWQRTRVEFLQTEYLEANDKYFTLLEEV